MHLCESVAIEAETKLVYVVYIHVCNVMFTYLLKQFTVLINRDTDVCLLK